MSFGFEVYGAAGNLLISDTSIAAAVGDIFTITAGSSGSTAYSNMVGHVLSITAISSTNTFDFRGGSGSTKQRRADVSVSYPSGVPTVSWSYTAVTGDDVFIDTVVYVFSS